MSNIEMIREASDYIKSRFEGDIEVGLILGSGLGDLADEVENPVVIDYSDIPHFPVSTVHGHAGQLVLGKLSGRTVAAMKGRFHYYEGYSQAEITFPVRVMKLLGMESMIVTNACGGLDKNLYPGALMLIEDQINLTGSNPLLGPNLSEFGPRFPDMSEPYSKELILKAESVASKLGIDVKKGVYTAISGPYYLSRAELRMIETIGSSTIGMSTIPETIVANHQGTKVLGISCITDMATPDDLVPLEHEEVIRVANEAKPKFISLVKKVLEVM